VVSPVTVAGEVLPTVRPLANDAAAGIGGLLSKLEKFFKIPADFAGERVSGGLADLNTHIRDLATPPDPTGWQKWLAGIQPLIGPSIKAIGGVDRQPGHRLGQVRRAVQPEGHRERVPHPEQRRELVV
jgi:hypothetical protein